MIEIGEIQGGKLMLRTTFLDEIGLMKLEGKNLTNALYWDSQAEAVRSLQMILEILTKGDLV